MPLNSKKLPQRRRAWVAMLPVCSCFLLGVAMAQTDLATDDPSVDRALEERPWELPSNYDRFSFEGSVIDYRPARLPRGVNSLKREMSITFDFIANDFFNYRMSISNNIGSGSKDPMVFHQAQNAEHFFLVYHQTQTCQIFPRSVSSVEDVFETDSMRPGISILRRSIFREPHSRDMVLSGEETSKNYRVYVSGDEGVGVIDRSGSLVVYQFAKTDEGIKTFDAFVINSIDGPISNDLYLIDRVYSRSSQLFPNHLEAKEFFETFQPEDTTSYVVISGSLRPLTSDTLPREIECPEVYEYRNILHDRTIERLSDEADRDMTNFAFVNKESK